MPQETSGVESKEAAISAVANLIDGQFPKAQKLIAWTLGKEPGMHPTSNLLRIATRQYPDFSSLLSELTRQANGLNLQNGSPQQVEAKRNEYRIYLNGITAGLRSLYDTSSLANASAIKVESNTAPEQGTAFSKVVAKEGRPSNERPGDAVALFPLGSVLVDGVGGLGKRGDDGKVADIVAKSVATHFSSETSISSSRIAEDSIVVALRQAEKRVTECKNQPPAEYGPIDANADAVLNIHLLYRGHQGERLLTMGNIGDATTYVRNTKSGELKRVSVDHSAGAYKGLDEEKAFHYPGRNQVAHFLGDVSGMSSDEIRRVAKIQTVQLAPEEEIISASDGILDNIPPSQLRALSKEFARRQQDGKTFVQYIDHLAEQNSKDPSLRSSYGKPDDRSILIHPVKEKR